MELAGKLLAPIWLFLFSFLFFWLVLPRLPGFERKGSSPLRAILFALLHTVTACVGAFIFFICLYMLVWMAIGGGARAASGFLNATVIIGFLAFFGMTSMYIFLFKGESTYLIRNRLAPFFASFLLIAIEGVGCAALFADDTSREGYIDKTGNFVIERKFATAGRFDHGVAEVRDEMSESAAYFIDKQGKKVEPSADVKKQYESRDLDDMNYRELTIKTKDGNRLRDDYSEGLAIARGAKQPYLGFVDQSEKLVIPEKFQNVRPFHEGLAAACIDLDENLEDPEKSGHQGRATWGYIDTKGNWVIKPRFSSAESFTEGLGCVGMYVQKDPNSKKADPEMVERYGFVDKTGTMALPLVFKYAAPFSEGLAMAALDRSSPPDELKKLPQRK